MDLKPGIVSDSHYSNHGNLNRGNKYDNVVLDINQLFAELDSDKYVCDDESGGISVFRTLWAIANRYVTGLTYLLKFHSRLLYANLILGWFFEFQKYWVHFLGNRPISVQGFHFLRNEYRKRFQDVGLTGYSDDEHLKSWQDHRNIYSVFGAVWNTSFTDLISCKYARYIKNKSHVLEYGCGIAPVTSSFFKYYPEKGLKFTIADITQFTFHYRARSNTQVYTQEFSHHEGDSGFIYLLRRHNSKKTLMCFSSPFSSR